ncbi:MULTISPECIES: hypothetical protein [unclassified Rhizobium]|uniref:hypothetical protein n=1 Tax=unclassified Rhizobium TaxID=2613769 RepID=UPI001ADBC3D1|nr:MULTISPECIES: hypothetical protein [unclassified Rhizobium]MBO9102180.1 hypothetical protein [Rhizobium sp. L58/93]MBO9171889.1 hypothetical protein [Rhizobium sp. L245/93]MBO9186453.1 hypothetical protein [Rhizobium sp. E27B/91]QXZ87194.1 hypothetical protein J5287_21760 [Rhizobium sp. K1/93]QXZ92773.1 hypothetical protein J5280_19135 [Rhizobium sp. K15/93]
MSSLPAARPKFEPRCGDGKRHAAIDGWRSVSAHGSTKPVTTRPWDLFRTNAGIRYRDVAEIRSELADVLAVLRSTAQSVEGVVILELNAILTVEQVIALVGEIDSAISEGCAIYSGQQERIDERYESFLRIIKSSK